SEHAQQLAASSSASDVCHCFVPSRRIQPAVRHRTASGGNRCQEVPLGHIKWDLMASYSQRGGGRLAAKRCKKMSLLAPWVLPAPAIHASTSQRHHSGYCY